MKPTSRRDEILLRDLPEELLVYDLRSHRAHCLNRTAAAVYRLSDGSRSVAELASALGEAVGARDERLVWAALRELDDAELMQRCPSPPDPAATRRAALRRIGLGTVLPLVASVLAPTPAMAIASGCVDDCNQPGVIDNVTPCTKTLLFDDCDSHVCIGGSCV